MDVVSFSPCYLLPEAFSLCLQDVDELNHAISGSDLELLQLKPGPFNGTLGHVSVEGLSIDQGTLDAPVRARGALDSERYGISFFHQSAQGAWNGHAVDASSLLYFMPGGELDGCTADAGTYGWTSLIFSPEWIESIARTSRRTGEFLLGTECRTFQPDPQLLAEFWQAVAETVTCETGESTESARAEWQLSSVRNALGALLTSGDSYRGRVRGREVSHYLVARQADRYMRERLDASLCIDDVSAAMRVSRRYLEYAFSYAFGTSPSRYLRLLRLHEVRRRLKNPDESTTVTSESFALGFNHMSLFSSQYREIFGECPSETLAAAKKRAGLPAES